MSVHYQAVGWNRQKKIYDSLIAIGTVLYLTAFVVLTFVLFPNATPETALIRAFGTGAFFLLHIILSIGPLCRISPRFLPFLYNRRHLGVTMFILALAHAFLVVMQYHAFSPDMNPIASIFLSNNDYNSVSEFPFHVLGFLALIIFFMMAATSHDFWLANLSAPIWKALHMLVYVAYGLLIAHVTLGIFQAEINLVWPIMLGLGAFWVISLHLLAAGKEKNLDQPLDSARNFVDVCSISEIPDQRARIFHISGERIAIFRYDDKISAVSNVCQHQNGPLGEGKVVDGCITCPWHGYQYKPEDGCSPAPFTEKIPTFQLKLNGDRVLVNPKPNPPGTHVEPTVVAGIH